MITIFFDGLCEPRNPGGIATYGYVIYKDNKPIKKGCKAIGEGYGMTNNVAEYSALKRAVEWLNEQNINDEILIKSETSQRFVPQIQKLLKGKKVRFMWIPREQNMEADMLSNIAYKRYRNAKDV